MLTLGYRAEQIIEWITGYRSLEARFMVEDTPLGTLGGVKAAQNYLDDRFIVLSGDALENVDFGALVRRHTESGMLATMVVTRVPDPRPFGVVEVNETGTVTALTEKPSSFEGAATVNCGIYLLEKACLELVPQDTPFDFSRDFFPLLIERGQLGAYTHEGYWSDIGTPRAYYDANFAVLRGGFFTPAYNRYRDILHYAGQTNPSLVSYAATVTGHIEGCIVSKDACVASGASLQACIVMEGATVVGRHGYEIIGSGFSLPVGEAFSLGENRKTAGIRTNL